MVYSRVLGIFCQNMRKGRFCYMEFKSVIKLIQAVGLAYAAVFLLLLAGNAVALSGQDPEAHLTLLVGIIFILGAFLAGFLHARIGNSGFLGGLLTGIVYITVIWMISLLFRSDTGIVRRLLYNAGAIAASLLGSWAGFPRRKRNPSSAQRRARIRKRAVSR